MSDLIKVHLTIKGAAPLLMHSERLVNNFDPLTKQLRKARNIISATNKEMLDPNERLRIDRIEQNLRAQTDAIRHLEKRQSALEQKQNIQPKTADIMQSKVDEAMKRIEALESFDRPVRSNYAYRPLA